MKYFSLSFYWPTDELHDHHKAICRSCYTVENKTEKGLHLRCKVFPPETEVVRSQQYFSICNLSVQHTPDMGILETLCEQPHLAAQFSLICARPDFLPHEAGSRLVPTSHSLLTLVTTDRTEKSHCCGSFTFVVVVKGKTTSKLQLCPYYVTFRRKCREVSPGKTSMTGSC